MKSSGSLALATKRIFIARSIDYLRQSTKPLRCICGARPAADGTIPCDH